MLINYLPPPDRDSKGRENRSSTKRDKYGGQRPAGPRR